MIATRTIDEEERRRVRVYKSQQAIRSCAVLSAEARLVLLELLELDAEGDWSPDLRVSARLIDAGLPHNQVTAALEELQRFRLLTVHANEAASLDLRLNLHFAAIESLLEDRLRGIPWMRANRISGKPFLAKTSHPQSELADRARRRGRRTLVA